jgi:16S rRNA (uracil1498-N3)-methyltransferase
VSSPPWFVASSEALVGGELILDEEESHHAVSVLRISPGDLITVTDGAGSMARCSVRTIDGGRVVARVGEMETAAPPRPRLAVYTGAAKGSKVDDVIDRLAQLGAAEVFVYSSTRTVANWDRDKRERLGQRWEAIARSAAKQSRSAFVTGTGPPLSWPELRNRVSSESHTLVLWEEATTSLRSAIDVDAKRIALVIGPEGGLSSEEAGELEAGGGRLVSLGPRILRTENAPVVAATAVLYHLGTIG